MKQGLNALSYRDIFPWSTFVAISAVSRRWCPGSHAAMVQVSSSTTSKRDSDDTPTTACVQEAGKLLIARVERARAGVLWLRARLAAAVKGTDLGRFVGVLGFGMSDTAPSALAIHACLELLWIVLLYLMYDTFLRQKFWFVSQIAQLHTYVLRCPPSLKCRLLLLSQYLDSSAPISFIFFQFRKFCVVSQVCSVTRCGFRWLPSIPAVSIFFFFLPLHL